MKKLFILAAVAASFTACSFDKDLGESASPTAVAEKVPLLLSAADGSIKATVSTTRSNVNNIQSDKIDVTSTAVTGLFILKSSTTTCPTTLENYEKWNLASAGTYTSNSNATDKINIGLSSTLYYPDNKGQGLDIYAYMPRYNSYASTGGTTSIASDPVQVTIQENQSTKANYLLSDVLWGKVGSGTGTITEAGNNSNAVINATQYKNATEGATAGYVNPSGEVIIPMFHKASKIIIKLSPLGMDLEKLKGATVKFYVQGTDATSPKLSTGLTLTTGAITNVVKETTEVLAPITFTSHLGQSEDGNTDLDNTIADAEGTQGVIGTANVSMSGYACSGIILPQTISEGQKLIEITLADANTTKYAYIIPTSETPEAPNSSEFQSGKVYTYTITLTASGLSLTTTVKNWEAGTGLPDSGTGSANLTD